jgi:hypothetical protein
MPKQSQALLSTHREVGSAQPTNGAERAEFRIKGSPNLVLRVNASGTRSWVLWVKRLKTRKWQKLSLGNYPTVSLSGVRDKALRVRAGILEGKDPFETRIGDNATLLSLGAIYIERHARPKKKSWREDERILTRDVYPALGTMQVVLARSDYSPGSKAPTILCRRDGCSASSISIGCGGARFGGFPR